jgi:hypothetical protein
MIFKYFKSQDSDGRAYDLGAVKRKVESFLDNLELPRFKVSAFQAEGDVIVLIQVEPHRNLRYSNLLEIKLKVYVESEAKVPVKAVFWRFKIDEAENKGALEQSVYEWSPPAGQTATPSGKAKAGSGKEGPSSAMMPPARTVDHIDLQEGSWDEFEQLSGKDKT